MIDIALMHRIRLCRFERHAARPGGQITRERNILAQGIRRRGRSGRRVVTCLPTLFPHMERNA